MATKKEVLKDYLNKCQFLQRTANYLQFTINATPSGFVVNIVIVVNETLTYKCFMRFRESNSCKVLEEEYRQLLKLLEKN